MRSSFILYPVVNAAHILAIGVLVTSAVLMDLRLLGLGRGIDADAVLGHLRPVAVSGLVVAVPTGLLLFSVRPYEYLANPAFGLKMLLLAAAGLNAVAFTLRNAHRKPGLALRLAVFASILLWPAVLLAGRFIGFLE